MPFFELWKNVPGLNIIAYQDCIDFMGFEKMDEDAGLSEPELEEKFGSCKNFSCSQPWEMPIIDIQGNVIPCGSPVREHNKDFILGNIMKGDTIESCYTGKKMQKLRELHNNSDWYKNDMCRTCVKSMNTTLNVIEPIPNSDLINTNI